MIFKIISWMKIIFGLCKTYAEEKSDTILHKNSNTNAEDISTLAYEENLTQEMELLTGMLFRLVSVLNIIRFRYYSKHLHNKEYQRSAYPMSATIKYVIKRFCWCEPTSNGLTNFSNIPASKEFNKSVPGTHHSTI